MCLQTNTITTASLVAISLATTGYGQTLITDTFERNLGLIDGDLPPFNDSNWGTADNGLVDGKTGTISNADYLTTLSGNGNEQTVGLTAEPGEDRNGELRYGRTILDVNLAAIPEIQQAGGFAIEFDINPADLGPGGGNGRDWGGFVLSDTNDLAVIAGPLAIANLNNQSVRFGAAPRNSGSLLLRPSQNQLFGDGNPFDGSIGEYVFDQPVFDDYSSNYNPSADPLEDFVNPKTYRVRAEITSDFSEGGASNARLFIGEVGQPLVEADLDQNRNNGINSSDFTWGAAGSAYIAFVGNTATHLFDNLLIEALADDPGIPGDFNDDTVVDAADIDLLTEAIRNGSTDAAFDLDGQNGVDAGDVDELVTGIIGSLFGDANLDNTVDLIDLSALATNFNSTAGWAGGNFNTDTVVDLIDLSLLATNFGGSTTIPEPASLTLLALGALAARRRS